MKYMKNVERSNNKISRQNNDNMIVINRLKNEVLLKKKKIEEQAN